MGTLSNNTESPKYHYLSPFLCILKLVTSLRIVGNVKRMITRCKFLQRWLGIKTSESKNKKMQKWKRNFKKESKTVKVSSPCHPHPRQRMYKSCLVQRRSRGWEGRWCTSGGGIQEVWTFWNWKIGEKRKRKVSVSFVNLLSGHLPGYSPANMVGYGGVSVVPPCWTNLGKEHSVLWFVALDCRDEPEQAEFESSPTSQI